MNVPWWYWLLFAWKAKRDWNKGVGKLTDEELEIYQGNYRWRKYRERVRNDKDTFEDFAGFMCLQPTWQGLLARRYNRFYYQSDASGFMDDWPNYDAKRKYGRYGNSPYKNL